MILDGIPKDYFSDAELRPILGGTDASFHGLLKRAVAKGDLLRIRRGLYSLSVRYQRSPMDRFALAQRIYGPSYVTSESALSFHGWIPEAVHAVTSATSKRSQDFTTPVGLFSYRRVLCEPLLVGVNQEGAEGSFFFMASPWRALADYVFIHKKDWKGTRPLIQSLRIEEDDLRKTGQEGIDELIDSYQSHRVKRFLRGLKKDLS